MLAVSALILFYLIPDPNTSKSKESVRRRLNRYFRAEFPISTTAESEKSGCPLNTTRGILRSIETGAVDIVVDIVAILSFNAA